MRVYLDNAASTPILNEVIDEVTQVMQTEFGNPSSIHQEGRKGRTVIEAARKKIANELNASLGEVFFTSGGTESSNTIIKNSVRDLGVTDIISSPTEHHCVLHSIADVVRTNGIVSHQLSLDEWGRPLLSDLEEKLKSIQSNPKREDGLKRVVLVSLMHVNNETGAKIDLNVFGALCHQYQAMFHSDTVQSVSHFKFDASNTPVDFFSGAAHKFHGPKGIGFMYISNDYILKPFLDGGSQERNMRAGTENSYFIAGMAKAFELACQNLEAHEKHICSLRDQLLKGLLEIEPNIRINTDVNGDSAYHILNVSFPHTMKAELLLFNLDIGGIAVSGGSACSSGVNVGSHVLRAMKGESDSMISIRFSFSFFNTEKEIDYALTKIKGYLK